MLLSILRSAALNFFSLVLLAGVALDDADAGKCFLHRHHQHGCFFFLSPARPAHFLRDQEDRQNAKREHHQCSERVERIEEKEHCNDGDQRDRMLDEVARQLRSGHLGHARLVETRLHQFAGPSLAIEFQRLAQKVGEQFITQALEHLDPNPEHAVLVQVAQHSTAQNHERHDGANPRNPDPLVTWSEVRRLEFIVANERHSLERHCRSCRALGSVGFSSCSQQIAGPPCGEPCRGREFGITFRSLEGDGFSGLAELTGERGEFLGLLGRVDNALRLFAIFDKFWVRRVACTLRQCGDRLGHLSDVFRDFVGIAGAGVF